MQAPPRNRRVFTYANVMSTIAVFGVLGGGAWAATKIGAGDIKQNAVRSKHIKNNQAKGADVKESSLGAVPEALIARHGGWGRQSGVQDPSCNPDTDAFVICDILNVSTRAPGRALVTGRIRAGRLEGDVAQGTCRLGSSTFNPIPGSTANLEVAQGSGTRIQWVTLVGITPPLPAGDHAFGIDCNDGLGDIAYDGGRVTVVMLSPD